MTQLVDHRIIPMGQPLPDRADPPEYVDQPDAVLGHCRLCHWNPHHCAWCNSAVVNGECRCAGLCWRHDARASR